MIRMGQHVADHTQPGRRADDVGARGGHQLAAHPDPVVDAVRHRRGGQPGGEADLVEAVEGAAVEGRQPLDIGRVGPETLASTTIRTMAGPGSTRYSALTAGIVSGSMGSRRSAAGSPRAGCR